jgi:hypothetical protein
MNNDIASLRSHLFNTLAALQDPEKPMDIDRAKAVCEVSSVIIDSAKAEIDFARVNGSVDTQFFYKPNGTPQLTTRPPDDFEDEPTTTGALNYDANKHGLVTVDGHITTHKLKG